MAWPPLDGGEIFLNGQQIHTETPSKAIGNGLALVTEDRLRRGGIHMLPIRTNLSLASLKDMCRNGFINPKKELDA